MIDHASNLTLLFNIIIVLSISGIIVPFFRRIGISSIIGYLICGLVIGPFGVGGFISHIGVFKSLIIGDLALVKRLGEFGIIFLMFMIGLKLSFKKLLQLKHFVLGLGISQIALTSIIIIIIARLFGNSMQTSILVGASLALSSTAVVMQILSEKHLINTPMGNVSFSVLLMQDLAVVPILVVLSVFASGTTQNIPFAILESLFFAIISVLSIILLSKLLLRPILNYLSVAGNTEWLTSISLFLVICISTITELAGLSTALGAFLAGLLISETEYKHEIEVIIDPLKGILLGIFFLSIGMSINIHAILDAPHWLFISIFGIFFIKILVLLPLCIIFNIPRGTIIKMVILLSGCGEFAFLILSIAMSHNMIPEKDAQFFLLVTAFSMILTPALVKLAKPIAKIIHKIFDTISEDLEENSIEGMNNHIIIAGFKKEEETLGKILEEQMIPFVAIDKNARRVDKLRMKGYNILYGNAKRIELWEKLNAKDANIAIINLDKINETNKILNLVKKEYPHIFIIVRATTSANIDILYDNGADCVVSEVTEANLKVAGVLLEKFGISNQEVKTLLMS